MVFVILDILAQAFNVILKKKNPFKTIEIMELNLKRFVCQNFHIWNKYRTIYNTSLFSEEIISSLKKWHIGIAAWIIF